MAVLSLEPDAPAAVIATLQRQIDHVSDQLRVEHAMTLDYRARYEACEKQRASLEKKLNTARRKLQVKSGQATRRPYDPADQVTAWLIEQEDEDEHEAGHTGLE